MAKQKKKKTPPSRRPATMADVKRAKQQAMAEAVDYASAIFMTVLLDKFNAQDHILDVWMQVMKLSEEISEGRVSVADLMYTLKTEYGIKFVSGEKET